jgi:hypothetical protein
MKSKHALTLFMFLLISSLVGIQSASIVCATYSIESIQISVKSPHGTQTDSTIPIIVDVNFVYGTSSALDEFSFQNVSCSYSLDNGEWQRINNSNVTSNKSQPDINFWDGLLHKLNVTYSTALQNLSEGMHFMNVTIEANDTFRIISSFDTTTFNVPQLPSPTLTPSENQSATGSLAPSQSSVASSSEQPADAPQPAAVSTPIAISTENIYVTFGMAIVIIIGVISGYFLFRRKNDKT